MLDNDGEKDMPMVQLWRYAVAGNIKKTRIDENGVLRYGTSAFKGKAKVYLSGWLWDERLPRDNKKRLQF